MKKKTTKATPKRGVVSAIGCSQLNKNSQGVYCLPSFDRWHTKKKLTAMFRRGYDAYGEGGFYCHCCGEHSPNQHKRGCLNANPTVDPRPTGKGENQ